MKHTTALAAAFALGLFTAGCGGGSNNNSPTSPTGSVITITITGQNGSMAFSPNPANVDTTTMVQFKNNDSVMHHIMMDNGSAQTADIPPGTTSAAIPVGTNKSYHCTIHPGLVGGFNGSTGDPPPNCSYAYC